MTFSATFFTFIRHCFWRSIPLKRRKVNENFSETLIAEVIFANFFG